MVTGRMDDIFLGEYDVYTTCILYDMIWLYIPLYSFVFEYIMRIPVQYTYGVCVCVCVCMMYELHELHLFTIY